MGASITLAGETLIAQKHAALQGLDVVRFIFANVAGLDPSGPVDRAAPKPAAGQIVHVYDIPDENAGYVNPNQVVYSSQIGSDIGDWDFNWIGLETAEGVLFAVAYVPLQIKRRNIPPLQIGNNLTRNFLVAFDGAQALTGITIDASTWQHDFTVRLAGIDERERLSNRDVYGRACFFGSSFELEKVASVYQLKPGTAYVEGIRLIRSTPLAVVPPAFPTTAWLDVALQRELSDVVASWKIVFAADRPDYTDSAGVRHYCVAIAELPTSSSLTDRRPVEPIAEPLVWHFAARVGDYSQLRARATTKGDVGLGNLPNAKSDDPNSNDSEILATTKALHAVLERHNLPLTALPFPTIDTPSNRLAVNAVAVAGSGGTVSIAAGTPLVLCEEVVAGNTARQRCVTTAAWTSPALAANSLYFLRAYIDGTGSLVSYVQKGADTDPVPGTLKGIKDGASGGGFDSTVLDVLMARILTGAAGTLPSVITLANARQLNSSFTSTGTPTVNSTFTAVYSQAFTLNWARKAQSVPVYAVVYHGGSSAVEGGTNYARNLVVTRYTIFCQIQTDWNATPTLPRADIEGSALA